MGSSRAMRLPHHRARGSTRWPGANHDVGEDSSEAAPRAVGGVTFSIAAVVASVAAYSGFLILVAVCAVLRVAQGGSREGASVFLSEGGVEEFFMNEGAARPDRRAPSVAARFAAPLAARIAAPLAVVARFGRSAAAQPRRGAGRRLALAGRARRARRQAVAAAAAAVVLRAGRCARALAARRALAAEAAEAAALASVKREARERAGCERPGDERRHDRRYLRGEKWREKVAIEAIRKSIAWRRETDAASRPHRCCGPRTGPSYGGAAEHGGPAGAPDGTAATARAPVFIDRTLGMDVNGMKRASSEWGTEVVEMALAEAERHTEFSARHYKLVGGGAPFETHVVVIDCAGMAMWTFTNHCIPVFKQISAQASAHYPDTVHSMIIVNAPRWFYSVYALVERFIDPVTRAKIQMCASTEALFELIPKQALPPCLGGTCADDHALGPP